MKFNRMEFLQACKFLLPAICTNENRKNLMHLHVKPDGARCIMTAANSFLIKRVILDSDREYENRPAFLVHIDVVKEVLLVCNAHKGKKKNQYFEMIEFEPGYFKSKSTKIIFEQPQFEYPNLDRLLVPTGNPGQETGVGISMLAKVLKDFPNRSKKEVIKISNFGAESPIVFDSQCGKYKAVLLPVRIKW